MCLSERNLDRQLSPSLVEWLSLIRYQVIAAEDQIRQPAPINALAINIAQDAVESVLSLVVQHRGGDVKSRPDFLQLFDAAMQRIGSPDELVAFRPSLAAMNTSRVNFKHYGNTTTESTVRRHVERAVDFVRSLCDHALGISLESVSLLVFIQNEQVREHLQESRASWIAGQREEATESLRLAFDLLIRDYTGRKQWYPGNGLFSTEPSFFPSVFQLRDLGIEKVADWLKRLDSWVTYLALGVDMRRYAFFDAHMPSITYAASGKHFTYHREGVVLTDEIYERCFKFVVDTSLAFTVEDYDYDAWEARQQVYREQEQGSHPRE